MFGNKTYKEGFEDGKRFVMERIQEAMKESEMVDPVSRNSLPKVGDPVRIKSAEELYGKAVSSDGVNLHKDMVRYLGLKGTITRLVEIRDGGMSYVISVNGIDTGWFWSKDWIEVIF